MFVQRSISVSSSGSGDSFGYDAVIKGLLMAPLRLRKLYNKFIAYIIHRHMILFWHYMNMGSFRAGMLCWNSFSILPHPIRFLTFAQMSSAVDLPRLFKQTIGEFIATFGTYRSSDQTEYRLKFPAMTVFLTGND
jgi:hypothetical protein